MSGPFDFSREIASLRAMGSWAKWTMKASRHLAASRARHQVEARYDAETAEAIAAAITSGKNPKVILERAGQRQKDAAERNDILRRPPPLHGSAEWATSQDLLRFLKSREGFEDGSSILLRTFVDKEANDPAGLFIGAETALAALVMRPEGGYII